MSLFKILQHARNLRISVAEPIAFNNLSRELLNCSIVPTVFRSWKFKKHRNCFSTDSNSFKDKKNDEGSSVTRSHENQSRTEQTRSVEFPQDQFSSMKYWETDFNDRRETEEEIPRKTTESDEFYNNWNQHGAAFDAIEIARGSRLTHVDAEGHASMVDVSGKSSTIRTARAYAEVSIGATAFGLVKENKLRKGDVLKVAELAGIMAAKETSRLIPLCHPLSLSQVSVRLALSEDNNTVIVESQVKTCGPTGVEMEALTAVSVAALTVYDMIKAVTREAKIVNIQLMSKSGGSSGHYQRSFS